MKQPRAKINTRNYFAGNGGKSKKKRAAAA
jgi:hypothetical protein